VSLVVRQETVHVMCPLPSVGEGSSEGLTKRMGEGDHTKTSRDTPHPSIAFKISSCPLPRRGEGKITTASAASNFSDAVVLILLCHKFYRLILELRGLDFVATAPQQGHRGIIFMSALIKRMRIVAMEFGM